MRNMNYSRSKRSKTNGCRIVGTERGTKTSTPSQSPPSYSAYHHSVIVQVIGKRCGELVRVSFKRVQGPEAILHVMTDLGFPIWLRINHFINVLCIFFLIRSGLQILADHPKLYWNDHCRPGSEWLKFGKKKMPTNRLFTSFDEAEEVSPVFAIPGGHHKLGAGRNWHFLIVPLWVLNGLSYVGLLFATGQWRRLIPTSW